MLLEKKRCLSILLMTDISSDEENSDYSDEGNSNKENSNEETKIE